MANHSSYSCVGNPMDRGTWWATVHRVAKSQTHICLTWRTDSYSPAAWQPVLINKTLLEHSLVHSFTCYLLCYMAELSGCNRDLMTHKV